MLDRILDAILFRFTVDGSDNIAKKNPGNTTGSILLGAMIRLALIIIIGWSLTEIFALRDYWLVITLIIIGFVFYPAYRQYSLFNNKMEILEETTLCGKCKHFDATGQLCKIYDEHVSLTYIPCNGEDWEPISYEERRLK